jgi:hypothetical protein
MYHPEALEPIVDFVRSIGVAVHYGDGAAGGFLPGINIHAGELHIDPDALLGSGDVLHEAGHIIGVPRRYWPRLGTDLQAGVDALLAEEREPDGGENPLLARAAQFGELMAQGWAYAVTLYLGVSPGCVFFPGSHRCTQYEGVHPIQQWIERDTHYGPLHLAHSGMTGFSGVLGTFHPDNGLPPFPHMTRWTVD